MTEPGSTGRMDQTNVSYRWYILLILTVTQIGASLAALSFGPLAPFLQESFQISRAQVGLLTSSLYFGSILVSIPTGQLADRLRNAKDTGTDWVGGRRNELCNVCKL